MYPERTVLEGIHNKLPLSFSRLQSLKKAFPLDRKNVALWTLFVLFIIFVFQFLSDGDFSFLLV